MKILPNSSAPVPSGPPGPARTLSDADREAHAREFAADPGATGDIHRWTADNDRWEADNDRWADESGAPDRRDPPGS